MIINFTTFNTNPKFIISDKPCLDSSNCFAINTEIMFHWINQSTAVDAYILEVFLDLETDKGCIVYQGNKSKFSYDAEEYNTTVLARLYAINIVGVSEFSDILCVKAAKGKGISSVLLFIFKCVQIKHS